MPGLTQQFSTVQIHEKAESVAAPLKSIQQQKELKREAVRQTYITAGPARQSQRAGVQRTRAKLQEQAAEYAENSDVDSLGANDSDSSSQPIEDSSHSKLAQKRKRDAHEEEFDPAGDTSATAGIMARELRAC